jgi:hypothetical protein
MYDAFGLDWTGLNWPLLAHRRLHCTAEQQTINQSYKACPSQEDSTKKAKQSK